MRKLIVVLATLALVAIGAVAYASIPGPDGVIHGCYKTSNPAQGALIAIDSAASCPNGYAALDWNQTGPPGPAGANGVSGYEVVTQSGAIGAASSAAGNVIATCPIGKVLLGGGWKTDPEMGQLRVTWSWPDTANNRWQVVWHIDTSFPDFTITGYATCASAS